MPEYGSTVLLLFILCSCVYKKHVRDWWWFRFGVISFVVHLATQEFTTFARSGGIYLSSRIVSNLVILLSTLSILAALVGLLVACLKHAQADSEYLRCLKCGYILKGLSEPRCPECGKQI